MTLVLWVSSSWYSSISPCWQALVVLALEGPAVRIEMIHVVSCKTCFLWVLKDISMRTSWYDEWMMEWNFLSMSIHVVVVVVVGVIILRWVSSWFSPKWPLPLVWYVLSFHPWNPLPSSVPGVFSKTNKQKAYFRNHSYKHNDEDSYLRNKGK